MKPIIKTYYQEGYQVSQVTHSLGAKIFFCKDNTAEKKAEKWIAKNLK